jgi:hypothetical protein
MPREEPTGHENESPDRQPVDAGVAGTGPPEVLDRLDALERAVDGLSALVRTQKLAVVDHTGAERIVAEVDDGNAELRIHLAGGRRSSDASVVIVSCPARDGLGDSVGVQLWARGNVVAELNGWEDEPGVWLAGVHVHGEPGDGPTEPHSDD